MPNATSAPAGHPLAADAGGTAQKPASYHHASLFAGQPAAASYTAPSSLPSTATSFWASNYASASLPLHQHQQWQPLQPATQPFPPFIDNSELKSADDDLSIMIANFSRSAPPPFTVPPQQPQLWMPSGMQFHPSNAMAAPVGAVPVAVMAAGVDANRRVLPGTQAGEAASNPAPRRRGRPRKITTVASAPAATSTSTKRAAPRRKAPVAISAAASGCQVRQPEQPGNGIAVAAAADHTAPCTNPVTLSLDQEPRQLQSASPSMGHEAAIVEEIIVPYADTSAPGVRFQPTDEELIAYLEMKYHGRKMPVDFIKDFDVYQAHPETVRDSCGESVDGSWYVFSPRKRRYENGTRPARSVGVTVDEAVGFWKSNTKETDIHAGGKADGAVIGRVTALTFQLGHQPKGVQTPWKMKEYCIPEKQHEPDGSSMLLDDWVICKLFFKEKRERKNKDFEEDQSGKTDEDTEDETEGDEDKQIVPDDQTLSNSEQHLCVEDYLVCDPTYTEQNHAAN